MKKRVISFFLTFCIAFTLLPTTALAAEDTLIDGWYYLRCMSNYLNITKDGTAELRKLTNNEAFYVTNLEDNKFTMKMKNGKYLGIEGERKNGARVVAVDTPYTWTLFFEGRSEMFSFRPPEMHSHVVNACEQKRVDGTSIIIWSHPKLNAPENAEFRFIPVKPIVDPSGESYRVFQKNKLFGYKDFTGNVVIPAKFRRAFDFSDGLALVEHPTLERYAFINTSGKEVTKYKYDIAGGSRTFSEGLIRIHTQTYSKALTKAIDGGDSIDYHEFRNGVGNIVMKSGKKFPESSIVSQCGFMNTKGQEVIKPQFYDAQDFHNGLAAVSKLYGFNGNNEPTIKVGWINKAGKLVIPYQSVSYGVYYHGVNDFRDGFVTYFVPSGNGANTWPCGGILDTNGKQIISAAKGKTFVDIPFGLQWKDGIIAVAPHQPTNNNGKLDPKSKVTWPRLSLYDYNGKWIASPKDYVSGYPLGAGYTLALHQPFSYNSYETPSYWSVFDKKGKIVLKKAEENNYDIPNLPYGYENGYIFFGNTRLKVSDGTKK